MFWLEFSVIYYFFLFFSCVIIEIIQIPTTMMSNARQPAKTLPCLFKDIVDKYPKSQLRPCKTDSQTWKHASAPAAVERVNKLAKYFPESSIK